MKNVLIVDDEKLFLLSLTDGLGIYAGEFNVITAENGRKAVELLGTINIDLIVTDLQMPVMDGFELLAHLSNHEPDIPVIVMTAYGAPSIEDKLRPYSVTRYLEKPLNLRKLASAILDELAASSQGFIQGITLPTFLQLVEMEKKTCTLSISSHGTAGRLFFRKGEFLDAETSASSGEDAAYEIVCWENAQIEIDPICRKKARRIQAPLQHIIMEGYRLKDERERRGTVSGIEELEETTGLDILADAKTTELNKEEVMALEKHLAGLKEVKGFKAAGIMNYTGEMLATESTDTNVDLDLVGATFNDIFRSAHEASKKIGLDACKETIISTPKGTVVMRCSGVDAKSHFHLIGVMAADGNQALMKMQIEKMVPAIMEELA
ncbi:MAG: response regulator [Nitrospirae bacterium]|nr:response regulator [Nitrospirota bacterium]